MSLNRRLRSEAPISGPYDHIVFVIAVRAGIGVMGLTTVIALLENYARMSG